MSKFENEIQSKRRAYRPESGEKVSAPHVDWERNHSAAEYMIKENQDKLPAGMSLQLDKFKLTFSFAAKKRSAIATPVSLHQDVISFLPEMRGQLKFYTEGASFYQKQLEELEFREQKAQEQRLQARRIDITV